MQQKPFQEVAISQEEFVELTRPLLGLPISLPWRGYGSALFLEVGPLSRTYERTGRKRGEWGVVPYYHWRVEAQRSVLFGSSSGTRKIEAGISALTHHKILELAVVGRLPELSIHLSDEKWICSFACEKGQPDWAVHLSDDSWLAVRRGRLVRGCERVVDHNV